MYGASDGKLRVNEKRRRGLIFNQAIRLIRLLLGNNYYESIKHIRFEFSIVSFNLLIDRSYLPTFFNSCAMWEYGIED